MNGIKIAHTVEGYLHFKKSIWSSGFQENMQCWHFSWPLWHRWYNKVLKYEWWTNNILRWNQNGHHDSYQDIYYHVLGQYELHIKKKTVCEISHLIHVWLENHTCFLPMWLNFKNKKEEHKMSWALLLVYHMIQGIINIKHVLNTIYIIEVLNIHCIRQESNLTQ